MCIYFAREKNLIKGSANIYIERCNNFWYIIWRKLGMSSSRKKGIKIQHAKSMSDFCFLKESTT